MGLPTQITNEEMEFSFQLIFGSIMTITMIFSLLLWFSMRDKSFIYLFFISFFALSYCWDLSGMSKLVIWANAPLRLIAFISVINQLGGFISGYLFYNHILPLKQQAPRLRLTFVILTITQCLMAIFRFITQNDLLPVNVLHFAGILWFICMITVVIYFVAKGNRQAKFLVFATAIIVSGAVLYGLSLEKIVLPLFQHSFQYGIMVYVFLLGIGAVDKLRAIRLEKEKLVQEMNVILEMKVEERTKELNAEKEKSDVLLLNILPEETAKELKKYGNSKARSFEKVTVLFTDFKNFTKVSESLSPEELVESIHRIYSEFDKYVSNYNVEKIKTLGDGYMAAGGLPVANDTNPVDVVNAALDMRDFIEQEKQDRINRHAPFFDIRIGVHTGPVVAGIVGIKKFAYDIWGDTVNIASRMESSSEPGKVNVSGTTYQFIKEHFNCEYRGKVHAKNKGEVDMYFVEHKI